MRTVSVAWDRAAGRFTALGTHAGREIAINAPHDPEAAADEAGEAAPTGFSATELLLAGAGACAAWDVVEILRKRRARISRLDVTVEGAQQPDPPWTYERLTLHFRLAGTGLRVPVIARAVRLSVIRYCSVLSTLAATAAIEATVELVASDGASTGRQRVELMAVAPRAPADTDEIMVTDEE